MRDSLRRAAPVLLAVHALRALWALLLLGPLYSELALALDRSVFRATPSPGDAALAVEVVAVAGTQLLPRAVVWLGAYVLLGPWLQQVLLIALAGAPLNGLAWGATRRYLRALALRLGALAVFALLAGGGVLALQQVLAWLPASAGLELGARVACLSAVLIGALLLATAHDLAQAKVARGAFGLASVRGAIGACTPGMVTRNLLALALAAALAVLAELASRAPLALPYAAGPTLVLVVQQALLFAALLARAAWLAHALSCPLRPRLRS